MDIYDFAEQSGKPDSDLYDFAEQPEDIYDFAEQSVKPEDPGALAVAGKAALRSAAPLAAGVAAGSAAASQGAAWGAAAGTAIGGPVGTVIGGGIGFVGGLLIGGMAAGWAANKLQDAGIESVIGKEGLARLDAEQQAARTQHPVASFAGELLPQLAMGRPNKAKVAEAWKLVKQLQNAKKAKTTMQAILATPEGKKSLLSLADVTMGGGSQGGMEAVRQIQEGEFRPIRLMAEILTGAVLNEPTKFGAKLMRIKTPGDVGEGPKGFKTMAEIQEDAKNRGVTLKEAIDEQLKPPVPEVAPQEQPISPAPEKAGQVAPPEPATARPAQTTGQPESKGATTISKAPEMMTPDEYQSSIIESRPRESIPNGEHPILALRSGGRVFTGESAKAHAEIPRPKERLVESGWVINGKFSPQHVGFHEIAVAQAFRDKSPVLASNVDYYKGLDLPEGYAREGDRYVFKPAEPVQGAKTPEVKDLGGEQAKLSMKEKIKAELDFANETLSKKTITRKTIEPNPVLDFIKENGGIRPYKPDPVTGKVPWKEEMSGLPRSVMVKKGRDGRPLDLMLEDAKKAGVVPEDMNESQFIAEIHGKRTNLSEDAYWQGKQEEQAVWIKKGSNPVPLEKVKQNAEFKIKGEQFKVIEEGDAAVHVKDGTDYWIPYEEDYIRVDKGSFVSAEKVATRERIAAKKTPAIKEAESFAQEAKVKKAERVQKLAENQFIKEKLAKKADEKLGPKQGQLLGEDEGGFRLVSEKATDTDTIIKAKADKAEAQAKLAEQQRELFGSEEAAKREKIKKVKETDEEVLHRKQCAMKEVKP